MGDDEAGMPDLVKWVIWVALCSSVVLYVVVLQIVGSDSAEPASDGTFKNALYAVGLVLAIASLGIKHLVRSRSARQTER